MARPFHRRCVTSVTLAYSRDPLEQIDSISGLNSDRTRWKLSQAAAIVTIEAGTHEFFLNVDGRQIKLTVFTHQGEKYLRTEREKTHPNELASLARG